MMTYTLIPKKNSNLKTYLAVIYFDDMFDKPHKRTVKIKARNKEHAEKILNLQNGVYDVEVGEEI